MLEPFTETPPRERPSTSTTDYVTSSNIFDAIEQMNLTDHENNVTKAPAPAPAPAMSTARPQPQVEKVIDSVFELDESDNKLMAICYLLQDFMKLHVDVRMCWHGVVGRDETGSDLITAAVVTHGANEIVHLLTDEFKL
jgi:hypothetical protein